MKRILSILFLLIITNHCTFAGAGKSKDGTKKEKENISSSKNSSSSNSSSVISEQQKFTIQLLFAAESGPVANIENLLFKNPDLNINATISSGRYKGMTPFHVAIENDRAEVVEFLLKNSNINVYATITSGRYKGMAPLHIAAYKGQNSILKELLEHEDVYINATVVSGKYKSMMPLHLASHKGHEKVVEQLLKHPNVNVYAETKDRYTAFRFAQEFAQENKQHEIVCLFFDFAFTKAKLT